MLPYIILGVCDLDAAIAATTAAGGTLYRRPSETAPYAMVKDPKGNQVEP